MIDIKHHATLTTWATTSQICSSRDQPDTNTPLEQNRVHRDDVRFGLKV
jgi:hypothetical protein